MPSFDAILTALADPFRIGLMLALVFTMLRTRAATGTVIPLAAGVVFVAIIIPLTLGQLSGAGLVAAVLAGIIANLVILGGILAAWTLWQRLRRAG